MTSTDVMSYVVRFAAKNLAHNLDFIPEDKLNWKPAPTANSAMEIANHTLASVNWGLSMATGQAGAGEQPSKITDVKELKGQLVKQSDAFAEALKQLTDDDLDKSFKLPWEESTLGKALGIAVLDTVNHHGQVTYIQTMLGDTEDHFFQG